MNIQTTNGTGNIQISADRDVIFQVVESIKGPEDINNSIHLLQKHLNKLQWIRGKKDTRIIPIFGASFSIIYGVYKWDKYSFLFFLLGLGLIVIANKLNVVVNKIDREIFSTESVLTELYKQKILQQLTSTITQED